MIVTRMESPAKGLCDECGCRFDEGFKLHFAAGIITRHLCVLCTLHLEEELGVFKLRQVDVGS